MRLRLPLYGKILTWFFLNMVIVIAVIATIFTLQFHFNLDWIFSAAGAQDRWEAVRNLIIDELEATRPDEWPQVLERYSGAYHVQFALFDEEARPLVGGIPELPAEVQTRVLERPVPSSFPTFMRRTAPVRTPPAPNAPSPSPTARDGTNRTDGTNGTNVPSATTAAVAPPAATATAPTGASPSPSEAAAKVLAEAGASRASSSSPSPSQAPTPLVSPSPSLPVSPSSTPPPPRRSRLPLRALMRTGSPTHYWLLASGRLRSPLIGEPMGIVLVARSQTISGGGLILDPRPWFYLGAGVVLFSLLFWYPLIRSITRTIRRMMQTTRQIADGRFDVRVNLHRRDELGALSDSIDQMAVRLDGLVTGQKRFLGDIAHELCSPLARLQMALGILEQRLGAQGDAAARSDTDNPAGTKEAVAATTGPSPLPTTNSETAHFLQTASEKAQQISALVAELLSFSKASFGASAVKLQPVPLLPVLEEAIHRETTGLDPIPDIRLESIPEDLFVSGDPDLLLRAFSNLVRNAIQHAGAAGPIAIKAESPAEAGEAVSVNGLSKNVFDRVGGVGGRLISIIVADKGPGVPTEELTKIFDAFYRLDSSRTRDTGGTGLGLAIVKTCIDSCCGTISAQNGRPTGLEVYVSLHTQESVPRT